MRFTTLLRHKGGRRSGSGDQLDARVSESSRTSSPFSSDHESQLHRRLLLRSPSSVHTLLHFISHTMSAVPSLHKPQETFSPNLFSNKVLFCTGGASPPSPLLSLLRTPLTPTRPERDMLQDRRRDDAIRRRRRHRRKGVSASPPPLRFVWVPPD